MTASNLIVVYIEYDVWCWNFGCHTTDGKQDKWLSINEIGKKTIVITSKFL